MGFGENVETNTCIKDTVIEDSKKITYPVIPEECKGVIAKMVESSSFENKVEVAQLLNDIAALSIPNPTPRPKPDAVYLDFVKLFIPRTPLIELKMKCIEDSFGSIFAEQMKKPDSDHVHEERLDALAKELFDFLEKVRENAAGTEPAGGS